MKHTKFLRISLVSLAALGMLALLTGGAFARPTALAANDASVSAVIDFEGLAEGAIVSNLSYGNGISGESVTGQASVFGLNPTFGPGTNAAMIFDSTCPPGNIPADCSGRDRDLYNPELGKIMIVSEDLDSNDPDDATNRGVFFDFDFSGFGLGKVTVDSLDVIDIDEAQQIGNAKVELYSGGPNGTLLGTVPIPNTGNNGVGTVQVGISGVDFMRVTLNGSGGIDNLWLRPEIEVLYLSNTDEVNDGKSSLYRVEIDEAAGVANLILLPNGVVNYDHVDAIAVTPSGKRMYIIDDAAHLANSTLAYYHFATKKVFEVGVITWQGITGLAIDQAAFSPDGLLYIASSKYDKLFTVDKLTAVATELGTIVNRDTGVTLDVRGADIAFTIDGTLYLWINRSRVGAGQGLYSLALPGVNGVVNATFIGGGSDPHFHRGMAVRLNGHGDLVGSTPEDEVHVMDRQTSLDVISPLPLHLNGQLYDSGSGDMSMGPFVP